MLSNSASGIFNWNTGSTLVNNYADNLFANAGKINVTVGSGNTANLNAQFNNSGGGTVTINSGTLSLNGGGTDSDSGSPAGFNIPAGSTLNFGGGTYTFNSGSLITGAGNVSMTGGTANFNGTLNVTGNYPINNGTANFNGAYTIGGSSAMTVSSATVNFNGGGTAALGSLTLNSSTLGGTNAMSVAGAMTFNSSTILNPAGVFANGTLLITGNPAIGQYTYTPGLVYGLLVNNGVATWNTGNLTLNGAGVLSNAPGGTFNWNVGGTLVNNYADNLFVNAGKINVTVGSGNTANLNAQFNNIGAGLVTVNSGTLSLNGGGTDSDSGGGFNVLLGATLNVGNSYTFNASSTISGPGNVNVSSGTGNFNGTLSLTGTYTINNSTANFNGAGTAALVTLTLNSATLTGATPVSVSGAMTFNSSTILNPAGVFANGTLLITGNPAIGQYTYTPGLVYGLLVNNGVATWNTGNLTLNGAGVLSNSASGIFNWNTGSTLVNNYADNLFVNAGKINVTVGSGNTANLNAQFNNSGGGTVTINSGTLSLNGGGADSDSGGGFNVLLGGTLNLGNTYTFNTSSTITGAGNVSMTGGTGNFNGILSLTGTYTINNSTANFNGAGTAALVNLILNSATLTGATPVSVSGAMTFNASTILNPAGVFANGTLVITNNPAIGQYTYTPGLVYGLLVNNGVATWNTGNLTLNGAGVLSNAPGGTFNWNAGGTLVNNYADNLFANAGQVNVAVGSGTASLNAPFVSSGTVTVNSGVLDLNSSHNLTGGTLNFGINSLTSYGQISLSGAAALTGTLSATLNNGFLPAIGNSWQLLSYGSLSGSFTNTNLPPVAVWQTAAGSTALTIKVTSLVPATVWPTPAPIVYGTALSDAQLDASSTIAGSFTYNPLAGTVIPSGNQTLSATFTPNDPVHYSPATLTTTINVQLAPLTVTANSRSKTYGQTVTFAGTEFTNSVLVGSDSVTSVTLTSGGSAANASVSGSPYSIVPGAAVGSGLTNYNISYVNGSLNVGKATPVITWANPSRIIYPAALTGAQLDATANVPGSFVYNPTNGTVLAGGNGQTLSTTFTPTDTTDYNTTNASVTINVVTCDIAPSGLVSWWKGDGNTFDVIGGNTGTLENGVTYTPGEVGQAFNFTAGQQMVVVGNPANLQLQNFTIEAWVQRASTTAASSDTTAVNGSAVLFAYGQGGYGLGMFPNGGLFLTQVGIGSVTTTASVTDTNWHHVAVAATNSGTVVFYTDGVASPAAGSYNPVYQFTTEAAIGGRADNLNGNNNDSFLGAIDEMSVYNRALAEAEIAAIYNAGPGGKCVPLAAITWANPADIVYGAALGGAQLNATANVAGAFSYNPPAGTILPAGNGQTLTNVFTPTDTADYPNPVTNTVTINVDPASLTVTANSVSKNYGQTVAFAGTEFTASALVGSDSVTSVTLTSAGAAANASVSGSPYGIAPGAAVGNGLSNYKITYVDGSLTVNQESLTITARNLSKGYGQALTFAGTEFIATGLQNGETVGSVTLSSAGARNTAPLSGSPYSIVPSAAVGGSFLPTNYDIAYGDGQLTVTPAPLTITASNASKNYGQTLTFAGSEFIASGLFFTDSVTSVTLTSDGAPATGAAGGHSIVPSMAVGTGLGNYTITYGNGLLTVHPASLTITASNASKIYGQTTTFAGTEFISFGLLNSDSIATVRLTSAGAGATAPVSGYAIVPNSAFGTGLGSYTITYNNGTLTVNPASLTITASNLTMTQGAAVPALTAGYSGFVNNENQAVLNGAPALSTTATSNSPVGPYPINVGPGTIFDPNYTYSFVPGTMTVQQPTLTITANDTNMTYGGIVPALSVTYSGFLNGDTAASLTTAPSVSTTGTSLSHVGNWPITASNAVDPNYTIVYVPGTLTINPAPLTITASNASKTYGQTVALPGTAFGSVGLLNGDTIEGVTLSSTGSPPTAAAGPYLIVPSAASGPRAGNYTITYAEGTLTVNPAPLTITAHNAGKYFGQTLTFAGTDFTASGLQNGETVGSVTLTSAGAVSTATVAGSPYPIMPGTATGGTFTAANYTINYVNGSLTVNSVGLPPMINAVLPSAGPNIGGTTVTISGTGFETGATVTFGSLPAASVTVDNSTVLTAVTPASPSGLVNVSVTNADGNSVTASNAFTFGLAPAITTQPTNLSVNQGLNAQFQVQATGDPTLTYQWKFNGNGLLENSHTMGTQTNTLTVNNVGPGDAGYYRCMVSNPYENITSAVAVLSVIVPPTTITVSPQSASAGNGGSASFSATANGTAPSYFWYQDSTLLPGQSGPVLNIANVQANASYTVVASNAAGSVASAPVTVTILTYCASVQAAQATYPEGTTFIPLSVQTFNCGSSAPMPNSGAAVWIYTAGTSRALPVTTDGSGNGTAYFTPLPVEVGLCQYGVALPGQGPPPVQGSFTIIGMNLSAQSESPQLIVGTPQTNTLLLNNLTAVPLTGITATILGAPTNVNVQVSVPASLPGNGAVQTTYVLEGIGTTASQVQFAIQYTSAQGASVTLPFNATVSPPTAQLSAMPASLVGTMIEGSQTLVPFIVTNTGGAASGPIQVNLPAAPWLSVVTAQPIASIAPNQSAQITLALTPTNGQQLGEYPGSLVVQGTNSSVTVPFVFTAVSTLAGNLQVTAQDEFANVGGATVTVSDFLSGATVGTQVTDSSGIVTFTGLTSAYYTVTVQAPDHGNFSTTLLVQANTTTPLTAFLPLQLVDYTWTVTPTTIPDTYNFTLTTVFVTEVPWPVVTVSPGPSTCATL